MNSIISTLTQPRIDHKSNLARAKNSYRNAKATVDAAAARHRDIERVLSGLRNDLSVAELKLKGASEEAADARLAARIAGKPVPALKETRLKEARDELALDTASAEQRLASAALAVATADGGLKAALADYQMAAFNHQCELYQTALRDFYPHMAALLTARAVIWGRLGGGALNEQAEAIKAVTNPPQEFMEAAAEQYQRDLEG